MTLIVLLLLYAHIVRFGVSHMLDFFYKEFQKKITFLHLSKYIGS